MSQPERDAVCGKLLAWHVVSLKCCFGQGDSCEIGNYLTNLVHFLISIYSRCQPDRDAFVIFNQSGFAIVEDTLL